MNSFDTYTAMEITDMPAAWIGWPLHVWLWSLS